MKKYFTILLPLLITSSVFSSDSNTTTQCVARASSIHKTGHASHQSSTHTSQQGFTINIANVSNEDSNKIERYLHKNFKIIKLDNGYEPEVVPRNGTGNLVREVFDHKNNVVIKELHTKDGCITKTVPLQPSAFDNR